MNTRWWLMWMGTKMLGQLALGRERVAVIDDFAGRLSESGDSVAAKFCYRRDVEFALAWALCGFPQVCMSHRFAASLMATSVPTEYVHDVVTPWDTFIVVVPDGLLEVPSVAGAWAVDDLYVWRNAEAIEMWTRSHKASILHRTGDNVAHLATACEIIETDRDMSVPDGIERSLSDDAARCACLLGRLLVGACIEMDKPKMRIEVGSRVSAKPTKRGDPKANTFQVGGNVRVDCRDWVTSYLHGQSGSSAAVQTMVRGHHKRQACGVGGADRKWIHIEPYWRGPEDAPIAVRPHVLTGYKEPIVTTEQ